MAISNNIAFFKTLSTYVFKADSPIVFSMRESSTDANYWIGGYDIEITVYNGTIASPTNLKIYDVVAPAGSMKQKFLNVDIAPYLRGNLDENNRACFFELYVQIFYTTNNGSSFNTATSTSDECYAMADAYSFDKNSYNNEVDVLNFDMIPSKLPRQVATRFQITPFFSAAAKTYKVYDVVNGVEVNEIIYTPYDVTNTTTVTKDIIITVPEDGFTRIKEYESTNLIRQKDIFPTLNGYKYDPIIVEYLNSDGVISSLILYGKRNDSFSLDKQYYRSMQERNFIDPADKYTFRDKLHTKSGKNYYRLNTGLVNADIYEQIKQMMLSKWIRINQISDLQCGWLFERSILDDGGTMEAFNCTITRAKDIGYSFKRSIVSYTETPADEQVYLKPTDTRIEKINERDGLINYTLNFEEANDLYFKTL